MLIVLAGLSGTGKSTLARALAIELDALWLRVDSIEQAIRSSGAMDEDVKDLGYRTAYAIAEDNLKLGRTAIGDSVNPWMLTRNAWRDAGLRASVRVVEIETICSDLEEHRRRIETRSNELANLVLPSWRAVIDRDYHAWDRDHLTIDTAGKSVGACVQLIRAAL